MTVTISSLCFFHDNSISTSVSLISGDIYSFQAYLCYNIFYFIPKILWDWKANINAALDFLESKKITSYNFGENQIEDYVDSCFVIDPHIPENTIFNGIIFSYNPINNEKSYADAIWIKYFNGAYQGNYIGFDNEDKENQS